MLLPVSLSFGGGGAGWLTSAGLAHGSIVNSASLPAFAHGSLVRCGRTELAAPGCTRRRRGGVVDEPGCVFFPRPWSCARTCGSSSPVLALASVQGLGFLAPRPIPNSALSRGAPRPEGIRFVLFYFLYLVRCRVARCALCFVRSIAARASPAQLIKPLLPPQALSNAGPPPAARNPARRPAEGTYKSYVSHVHAWGTQRGNMSQAWYRSCSSRGQLVDSSWFETASLYWLAAQGVANLGVPLSPQSKTCSGSSTFAPLPQQDYVFFVAAVMFSCEQKS